ncbi:MAG: hypothetical protein NC132_06150 [Corallococcus sp.]|nr:hypothetical protein [Corallococcus sp.]MCM1360111.1 hypothetical protein [Corallococcus sp.]MCM1395668.1 hypothetical protein [Corallococcus sp.]
MTENERICDALVHTTYTLSVRSSFCGWNGRVRQVKIRDAVLDVLLVWIYEE